MNFDTFLFSDKGGREQNEDYAKIKDLSVGKLCVLADGLGGHKLGEVASKTVVNAFENAQEPLGDADEIKVWFEKAMDSANQIVLDLQEENACKMKSTAVALLVLDDKAYWAHTGDSRLYFIHNKELVKITEDHSVAYKKYKSGEITKAQIAFDEDQSMLLRAIGGNRYQPDFDFAQINEGDGFLLCSDGLWEYLNDTEVLLDYLKADCAKEWAELMLVRAMERIKGQNDNLSLITVLVK